MPTLAAKTDYLAKTLLDHVLHKTIYTAPETLYVALFDVDPGKSGTSGVEVSGGGYERQAVTFGDVSAGGTVSNSVPVVFPDVLSSWGSVGGFALMDAATGGNMLYRGDLERPDPDHAGEYRPQATVPAVGDVFIIKTSQLVLTEK